MPNEFRDTAFLISRQASLRVLRPRTVTGTLRHALKTSSKIWLISIYGTDTAINFQGRCMRCVGHCSSE